MKKNFCLFLALVLSLSMLSAFAETPVTPITELDTENYTVDPANPKGSQYYGLYSIELTMESGVKRSLYQYVPTTWVYRQPEVAVAVPSGEDPVAFFENTGWKDASENGAFAVVLMVAGEGGWQADESEYAYAAFGYMDDRTYLQTQDSAFYMVGYGDAANTVMAHAVTNSELFAGFAALGVDDFDVSILDQGRTEESGAKGVMKSEVAVPMWIAANEKTPSVEALIEYWKHADECGDEALSSAWADEIYSFPEYLATTYEKTYAHVSKVYVTYGLDKVTTPEFTNNLWSNFLRRVRRQDSGAINALRWFASNDELGMDHHTLEVDGITRHYWVYVPSSVKASGNAAPVVFVAHGGGGSGEEFPSRSGWTKTAEERDFIVVYLSGSRSGKFKAGSTWSAADVPYFKQVREEVLAGYAADATRLYITGHSQGSVMTYNVTLLCPELVAAACGNDGIVYREKIQGEIVDNIVMPFMLNIGDQDKHFIEGGGNYGQVPDIVAEWAARYHIDPKASEFHFRNGKNYGTDYRNAQGLVVIREQWNQDKIHAMVPDDSYTIYDFLCNYSRGEDGTSYYMGVAISLQ